MPISKAFVTESAYDREYADNNLQIDYELSSRFGKDKAFELDEIYYNNFISSEDIATLRDIGVNVVRVPVEWSYFADVDFIAPTNKSDIYGYTYTYKMLSGNKLERRLKHLDWIVSECQKNGIYVIFDLHVVDGGQNSGGIRSKRGGYTFFEDTKAQTNAIEIWKIIANRFINNPTIAGYELLNEPGTKNINSLINYYKNAYNAIRSAESNAKNKHIIIMETPMHSATDHLMSYLEKPSNYGFSNVAYSTHDYFTTDNTKIPTTSTLKSNIKSKVDKSVATMKSYNIPLFVGETNFLSQDIDEVWKYAMSLYDGNFISYTFWAYKVAKDPTFGIIYYLNSKLYPSSLTDIVGDSYDKISNIFSLKTSNGRYTTQSNKFYNVIKSNFNDKIGKPIVAKSSYACSVGEKVISTIKVYSRYGDASIVNSVVDNNSIASVKYISPTGPICSGSDCQTIEIDCKSKGTTKFTTTSSLGITTVASITVN